MKKLLSIIIAAAIAVSLVACGGGETTGGENNNNSSPAVKYNTNVENAAAVQLTADQQTALDGAIGLMDEMLNNYAQRKADGGSLSMAYYKSLSRNFGSKECTNASPFETVMYFLKDYEAATQRKAIYVTGADGYHFITYIAYNTRGDDFSTRYLNICVVQEDGQWKYYTDRYSDALTERINAAGSQKFNFYVYDEDVLVINIARLAFYAYKDPYFVPEGETLVTPLWMAQEDNGKLCVEIYMANGTEKDVAISDVSVSLTDALLEDVYVGALEGDPVLVPAGEGVIVQYYIPADKVASGTEEWCLSQTMYVSDYNIE